jgi:hypothetical protein
MSKNIPASVRQRLRDLAGRRNEEFGLVLTKYGLERVLFRLSRSEHRDSFVLKGALLFELWTKERHRPTRDVDFLAYGPNDLERFIGIFRELCSDVFEEDGLTFDVEAIKGERIKLTPSPRPIAGRRCRLRGHSAPVRRLLRQHQDTRPSRHWLR